MQSKLNAAVDNTQLVVELVKFWYQIEKLSLSCKCLSGRSPDLLQSLRGSTELNLKIPLYL